MTARAPFTREAFPSSEDWEIGQVSPGRLTTRDVARDQGDSAAAGTLYEQCLAIFRELGDRWGIAAHC